MPSRFARPYFLVAPLHVWTLGAYEVQALLMNLGFAVVSNKRIAVFDRLLGTEECPA